MRGGKPLSLLAFLALACACFAGGDAEWANGVNSINSLRKDINSNSAVNWSKNPTPLTTS